MTHADAHTAQQIAAAAVRRLARTGTIAWEVVYTAALVAAVGAWAEWDGRGCREGYTGRRAYLAGVDAMRSHLGRRTAARQVPTVPLEDDHAAPGRTDARCEARQALRLLRPHERRVAASMARGETQCEIAARFGVTEARISQIKTTYQRRVSSGRLAA